MLPLKTHPVVDLSAAGLLARRQRAPIHRSAVCLMSGSKVKRPWRTQPWPRPFLADGKTKRYVLNYRDP